MFGSPPGEFTPAFEGQFHEAQVDPNRAEGPLRFEFHDDAATGLSELLDRKFNRFTTGERIAGRLFGAALAIAAVSAAVGPIARHLEARADRNQILGQNYALAAEDLGSCGRVVDEADNFPVPATTQSGEEVGLYDAFVCEPTDPNAPTTSRFAIDLTLGDHTIPVTFFVDESLVGRDGKVTPFGEEALMMLRRHPEVERLSFVFDSASLIEAIERTETTESTFSTLAGNNSKRGVFGGFGLGAFSGLLFVISGRRETSNSSPMKLSPDRFGRRGIRR